MNGPDAGLPHNTRHAAQYAFALQLLQSGRISEALSAFDTLLAVAPAHVEALNDSAVALAQLGRGQEALDRFQAAVSIAPSYAAAHFNLGSLLLQSGSFDGAADAFTRALAIDSSDPARFVDLGNAHLEAMRPASALAAYDDALRRDPNLRDAMINRSVTLRSLNRDAEAEAACRDIIARFPDDPDGWGNLGFMLQEWNRIDEAYAALRRALDIAPQSVEVGAQMCSLLLRMGRRVEALALAQALVRAHPESVRVWAAQGHAQMELAAYDAALASFATAHTLAPTDVCAAKGLACTLLLRGDFAGGLPLYESRLTDKTQHLASRQSLAPSWDGNFLSGKTVVVTEEQGAGDTLQFVRYAAVLKARGAAQVLVTTSPELADLLATVSGVDAVIRTDEPLPACDFQVAMMSLPRCCGTTLDTIPCTVPYLCPPDGRIAERVAAAAGLRVGIVWSGNPLHRRDHLRSMTLAQLLSAVLLPGVALFSLQKGEAALDVEPYHHAGDIVSLDNDLQSFSDTATVIGALDIVVTVDTSICHLAGALGKETWVLLPKVPDWRWLVDRSDSPWYPTMRLFRQEVLDDWSGPLASVREALRDVILLRNSRSIERSDGMPDATVISSFEEAPGESTITRRSPASEPSVRRTDADRRPEGASDYVSLAISLREQGKRADAITACRSALLCDARNAAAYANLALLLREEYRLTEAVAVVDAGLQANPDHPMLLVHLAELHRTQGEAALALSVAIRAVDAHPRRPETLNALGCALMEHGRLVEAKEAFRRALASDPQSSNATYNFASLLLLEGDFANGLPGLESRREVGSLLGDSTTSALEQWDGGPLGGRTIFIKKEQGLGDLIQFVRYAAVLKQRGAGRVILESTPDAARLLGTAVGVDVVVTSSAMPESFDIFVPLMSLPYCCGTRLDSIPADISYLSPLEQPVASRVRASSAAVRVGFAWGGNPNHGRDRYRSIPIAALFSALQCHGVELFSLQKGEYASALTPWITFGVTDLGPELENLDDTASAIASLDLIVSVDTAVAHLAGALGKPVWLLLPAVPDWRWLLRRGDSPWYPTMKLFRQDVPGDWTRPLGRLRAALHELRESSSIDATFSRHAAARGIG